MYKGAQTYTFRDFLSDKKQFEESLKKVKAIGYESVQHGTPPFMTAAETKAMLDDIGLIPCSSGFDLSKSGDAGAVKKAVETAEIYGVKYISVGSIPDELRECPDGYKKFAGILNDIGREFMKEGCGVLYHNHAIEFFSFGGGKNGMDILINETDSASVFFCLDTHWLASGGVDPSEWILRVKNRMPIIHFKDYAIGGGATFVEGVCKRFAEVGEGNLNWERIVKACNEAGVVHAIVEQDTCIGDPFDCLTTSFKNMVKYNV